MISTGRTIRVDLSWDPIVRVSTPIPIPHRRNIRWDAEDVPEFLGLVSDVGES